MNFCMFCRRTFPKSLYNVYSTEGGIFPFKDLIMLLGNIDLPGDNNICVLCLTVIRIISNYRKLLLQIATSDNIPESEEVVAAFEGFLNLLQTVPYSVNTDEEILKFTNENLPYYNYYVDENDSELTSTLYSEPITSTDNSEESKTKKTRGRPKKKKVTKTVRRSKSRASSRFFKRFCYSTPIYDNDNCLINKRTRHVGKLQEKAADLLASKELQNIIYQCQINVCYQEYESLDQLKGHLIFDHVSTLKEVDSIDYNEWLEEYDEKDRKKQKFPLKYPLKIAESTNKYPCLANSCRKRCSNIKDLAEHKISDHHLLACYSCKECHLNFSCEKDLLFHKEKNHSEIITMCIFCSEQLNNEYQLHEHLESHRIYSLSCKYCDKYFLDYTALSYHNKIHEHDKQRVKINRCKPVTILERVDTFSYDDSESDEDNGEFCKIREQPGLEKYIDGLEVQEYDFPIEQERNENNQECKTRIHVDDNTYDTNQDFGLEEAINKVINELDIEEYINTENLSIIDGTITSDEAVYENNIAKLDSIQNEEERIKNWHSKTSDSDEEVKSSKEIRLRKKCRILNDSEKNFGTQDSSEKLDNGNFAGKEEKYLKQPIVRLEDIATKMHLYKKHDSRGKYFVGHEGIQDSSKKQDTNNKSVNANFTDKEEHLKILKQKQPIVVLEDIRNKIHLYKKQQASGTKMQDTSTEGAPETIVVKNKKSTLIATKNTSDIVKHNAKETQVTSKPAESEAVVKKGRLNDTDFSKEFEVSSDKHTSFNQRSQTRDEYDIKQKQPIVVLEDITTKIHLYKKQNATGTNINKADETHDTSRNIIEEARVAEKSTQTTTKNISRKRQVVEDNSKEARVIDDKSKQAESEVVVKKRRLSDTVFSKEIVSSAATSFNQRKQTTDVNDMKEKQPIVILEDVTIKMHLNKKQNASGTNINTAEETQDTSRNITEQATETRAESSTEITTSRKRQVTEDNSREAQVSDDKNKETVAKKGRLSDTDLSKGIDNLASTSFNQREQPTDVNDIKEKQPIVLEGVTTKIHLYERQIASGTNEMRDTSRVIIEEAMKTRLVSDKIIKKNTYRKRQIVENNLNEAQVADDKSVQAGLNDNDFGKEIEVSSDKDIYRNDLLASTSFDQKTNDVNDVIQEIPQLSKNAFSEKPKTRIKSLRLSRIVKRLIEEKTKK